MTVLGLCAGCCSPGTVLPVLTPLQNDTLTEVHSYVSSREGQDRIHRALQRHRLPTALDTDVEEMVLSEARRFVLAGGEITSVPGWCSARIRARAVDLARGAIRRDAAHAELARRHAAAPAGMALSSAALDDQDNLDQDNPDQDGPTQGGLSQDAYDHDGHDTSGFAGLDENLSGIRRAVLHADAQPLDVCAALTAIAVLADAAAPAPSCPRPLAGATPLEAACWAGLWYANRQECFGDGNTVTKRRSRASKKIKSLLHAALGGPA